MFNLRCKRICWRVLFELTSFSVAQNVPAMDSAALGELFHGSGGTRDSFLAFLTQKTKNL